MNEQKSTKIFWIAGAVVIMLAVGAYFFFFTEKGKDDARQILDKPLVVEETLVIPDTQEITGIEGRFGVEGSINVPLVPMNKGDTVIVSKAVLTVKGSYDLSAPEAEKWSADATLAMVRSLGAVTLEGKSSQWQLLFSSNTKKSKGYEIIIQADKIVSEKEIDSTVVGAELPTSFKDSGKAIVVLQELPQYSDATISALNLYYNTDGKFWRYTLSTSNGSTSVAAE